MADSNHGNPKIAVIIGIAAGFLVWALSPLLTGKNEPWDAMGYYLSVLFFGGLLSGLFLQFFWQTLLAPISLIVGQALYLFGGGLLYLFKGSGFNGMIFFGMFWVVIYSFPTWIGACVGAALRSVKGVIRTILLIILGMPVVFYGVQGGFLYVAKSSDSEKTLTSIAKSYWGKMETVQVALANNPSAPLEILRALANSKNYVIPSVVARNPHTPPNILKELMDRNPIAGGKAWNQVWSALAINPNTPIEVLNQLSSSDDISIWTSLIANPSPKCEILKKVPDVIRKDGRFAPKIEERMRQMNCS